VWLFGFGLSDSHAQGAANRSCIKGFAALFLFQRMERCPLFDYGTKKADLPWGKVCDFSSEKRNRLFLVADFRGVRELAEFWQRLQAWCFGIAGAAEAARAGDHGGGSQGDECQGADHVGSVFLVGEK
jgi:hypothetical protein